MDGEKEMMDKGKRLFAMLAVGVLVIMLILTMIFGFLGDALFIAMLTITVVTSVILWIILAIMKSRK